MFFSFLFDFTHCVYSIVLSEWGSFAIRMPSLKSLLALPQLRMGCLASDFTSPSLSFHIYKVQIIITNIYPRGLWWGLNKTINVKYLTQCLASGNHSINLNCCLLLLLLFYLRVLMNWNLVIESSFFTKKMPQRPCFELCV